MLGSLPGSTRRLLCCLPMSSGSPSCFPVRHHSQVLGTGVPVFRHFPYGAQDTLRLYKDFLKLIYRHHRPEEQKELLFRLRQEFAARRHLRGPKPISAALRRGAGILEFQRQVLESSEERRAHVRGKGGQRAAPPRTEEAGDGATSVNGAWAQLQKLAGNALPGLAHYHCSLPVQRHQYCAQGSTPSIYSRRRWRGK